MCCLALSLLNAVFLFFPFRLPLVPSLPLYVPEGIRFCCQICCLHLLRRHRRRLPSSHPALQVCYSITLTQKPHAQSTSLREPGRRGRKRGGSLTGGSAAFIMLNVWPGILGCDCAAASLSHNSSQSCDSSSRHRSLLLSYPDSHTFASCLHPDPVTLCSLCVLSFP